MSNSRLRSLSLAVATATAALMLASHNAGAMDTEQALPNKDTDVLIPSECNEKSQLMSILKKQDQHSLIIATQGITFRKANKLDVKYVKVIITSNSTGEFGYELTEDGCIPDKKNSITTPKEDNSTESQLANPPVGMHVTMRLTNIHLYNYTQEGAPASALIPNEDDNKADKECERLVNDPEVLSDGCGPHNIVLQRKSAAGDNVMLQAGTMTDKNTTGLLLTVLGRPTKGTGEAIMTTRNGSALMGSDYTKIGYSTNVSFHEGQ